MSERNKKGREIFSNTRDASTTPVTHLITVCIYNIVMYYYRSLIPSIDQQSVPITSFLANNGAIQGETGIHVIPTHNKFNVHALYGNTNGLTYVYKVYFFW